MPRDVNGNYTLPPVYLAVTGQTVLAEQHNSPLQDVGAALTGSIPRNGSAPMLANLPMAGFRITGLATGTAATDAATVGQVQGATPIGAVMEYSLTTAPDGWMLCDGRPLRPGDADAYRSLLLAASSPYGTDSGDPRIPDHRGRVGAGKDNMGGTAANRLTAATVNGLVLGAAGGIERHALTIAEMPGHNHGGTVGAAGSHAHSVTIPGTSASGFETPGPGNATSNSNPINVDTNSVPNHTHGIDAQGGGAAHTNVQPTIVMNYIVKVT